MYLGGNGFYWVTSLIPRRPHVLEVRRGHAGTRVVGARSPARCTTPRPASSGGLWRFRGRPPQRLAGVGFTAQGFDASLPYRLTPAARDPRVASIFEGVRRGRDDRRSRLGAGRRRRVRDRPRRRRARARRRTRWCWPRRAGSRDVYQGVVEDIRTADSQQGGTVSPQRARGHRVLRDGRTAAPSSRSARSPGAARSRRTAATTTSRASPRTCCAASPPTGRSADDRRAQPARPARATARRWPPTCTCPRRPDPTRP